MPKVIINDSQGLKQVSGSGVEISSVVKGALVDVLAATTTLTLADSGAVLLPTTAGAKTYTLPLASTAAGFHVTLISGVAEAHIITTTASETKLNGAIHNVATDATTAVVARHTITLASPAIGDNLTIVCDGANYYVHGTVAAAPTLAG